MPRIWIDAAAVLLAATLLGGCATSKEKLLPHGDSTMLDIWHRETGGSAGGALDWSISMASRAAIASTAATPAAVARSIVPASARCAPLSWSRACASRSTSGASARRRAPDRRRGRCVRA